MSASERLPVVAAHELAQMDQPAGPSYLVESLWSEQAVGIIGGEPKCCKSFLALHLAVAVASGTACLGRFAVSTQGRVLVYPAEDSAQVVRHRLAAISHQAGTALEALDLGIITAPAIRLDQQRDRDKLARTVVHQRPILLVLDPFVRLHRVDENASGDVAPLLAFLREMQRSHGVAIALVHHARKGGNGMRAGQALRGSSEFHAWGDSNLYLQRRGQQLRLEVEHRAAPSIEPLTLQLATGDQTASAYLQIRDEQDEPSPPAARDNATRVIEVLEFIDQPISRAALRDQCRMKTATLSRVLAELIEAGRIVQDQAGGYRLPAA